MDETGSSAARSVARTASARCTCTWRASSNHSHAATRRFGRIDRPRDRRGRPPSSRDVYATRESEAVNRECDRSIRGRYRGVIQFLLSPSESLTFFFASSYLSTVAEGLNLRNLISARFNIAKSSTLFSICCWKEKNRLKETMQTLFVRYFHYSLPAKRRVIAHDCRTLILMSNRARIERGIFIARWTRYEFPTDLARKTSSASYELRRENRRTFSSSCCSPLASFASIPRLISDMSREAKEKERQRTLHLHLAMHRRSVKAAMCRSIT